MREHSTTSKHANAAALACVLLFHGSCGPRPDEVGRSEMTVLTAAASESDDGVARYLIARQRALFAHLSSPDRRGIGEFFEAGFGAGYFALLDDSTRLGEPPTQFVVRRESGSAYVVTARTRADGSPIVTWWRLTAEGWRVSGIAGLVPAPAVLGIGRMAVVRSHRVGARTTNVR
jgi:hypothetical protein